MTAFLAIDGGNSKTDVVVGTADGRVLAYARGPGTCYQNIGLETTMDRLRGLVGRALGEAGLDGVERADVFLAGADLPEEVELLRSSVAAEGWTDALRLENDTFALLRAGTDAADAVAVVCGAGINCAGRTADGRTARFPSLGTLSGDWGGGGHLASLALWHAVRGEDGRGPHTALSAAVAAHFDRRTAEDVSAALHLGGLDRARVDELTPVLFAVAGAHDPVALSVVAQQAAEIVALVRVAAERLRLLDAPVAVVLGGGVLRAGHAVLLDPVLAGIQGVAPKATVTVVQSPPVLGAALSSLDELGAPVESYVRLRGALAA